MGLQPSTDTSKCLPRTLILAVFVLFVGDTLFQITLPTVLVARGGFSGATAGLLLSVGMGVGAFLVAPLAQRSDIGPRSSVLVRCAIPLAGATVLIVVVLHLPGQLWLWLLPLVLYGLLRTPTTVMLLAYVSEQPDMLRMQAANGMAQRGAGAVAALVVATASFAFGVTSPLVVMALTFVLFAAILTWLRTDQMSKHRASSELHEASLPDPQSDPTSDEASHQLSQKHQGAYGRSLARLRTRRLQASSALNTAILLVSILGNAFFPLGLIGETPALISAWVLAFLVTRDLFGSVLAGSLLRPLYQRVGLFGALVTTAVLFVGGLLLLAIPGRVLAVVLIAALCQGMGCAIAIGCTNLLVAGGAGRGERALRIGATQYLPALVMLLSPAPLGFILDVGGIEVVFLAGALLCAALMAFVIRRSYGLDSSQESAPAT